MSLGGSKLSQLHRSLDFCSQVCAGGDSFTHIAKTGVQTEAGELNLDLGCCVLMKVVTFKIFKGMRPFRAELVTFSREASCKLLTDGLLSALSHLAGFRILHRDVATSGKSSVLPRCNGGGGGSARLSQRTFCCKQAGVECGELSFLVS